MNRIVKSVLLAATCLTGLVESSIALGRTIAYSGKLVTVTIGHDAPTLFRFEKSVKTISNAAHFVIQPASEDSPDYATLAVAARTPNASGTVNFILADGTVIKTKIVTVAHASPEHLDSIYDFKVDEDGSPAALDAEKPPEVKSIDLMKAMVRGDKVSGYDVRELSRPLKTGIQAVTAELVKIYTGGDFNGYVFRLVNDSRDQSYVIDVRRLRLGEPSLAILSQVDRRELSPFGSGTSEAYLRIVAKPSSLYRDIVLPVQKLKKAKE